MFLASPITTAFDVQHLSNGKVVFTGPFRLDRHLLYHRNLGGGREEGEGGGRGGGRGRGRGGQGGLYRWG